MLARFGAWPKICGASPAEACRLAECPAARPLISDPFVVRSRSVLIIRSPFVRALVGTANPIARLSCAFSLCRGSSQPASSRRSLTAATRRQGPRRREHDHPGKRCPRRHRLAESAAQLCGPHASAGHAKTLEQWTGDGGLWVRGRYSGWRPGHPTHWGAIYLAYGCVAGATFEPLRPP
jgi:hypothetical protein